MFNDMQNVELPEFGKFYHKKEQKKKEGFNLKYFAVSRIDDAAQLPAQLEKNISTRYRDALGKGYDISAYPI